MKLKVSIKIIEIKVDKIKIDEFNIIIPLDKIGSSKQIRNN